MSSYVQLHHKSSTSSAASTVLRSVWNSSCGWREMTLARISLRRAMAHVASYWHAQCGWMLLTYCYRLLPSKPQHRALEAILEAQRQLYNAALEERMGAFRNAGLTRTYVDQCKALTEWRRSDPEARQAPLCLQRWTLKQLDEAYRGFFRRVHSGSKPGFPRFRGKGRFASFGFREFSGIGFENRRLRFKGMPGGLRVHLHRPLPEGAAIRCCVFRRERSPRRASTTCTRPPRASCVTTT